MHSALTSSTTAATPPIATSTGPTAISFAVETTSDAVFNRVLYNVAVCGAVRFMDLPPELRLRVYEHLVVVGKVYYLPESYYPCWRWIRFEDQRYY